MAANNELGTLYPIPEITRIAHRTGASSLVDATQAAGRLPLSVRECGITYLALSAHKMYGPKGAGALITAPDVKVRTTHGRLASTGDGTPNVPGIVGLGEACRLRFLEMGQDEPRIALQRDRLEAALVANIENLMVNGDHDRRLSNNLHISVPDIPNDAVLARLRRRIAISTGAACSSSVESPSHVLQAMGLPASIQDGALRIGLGKFTTDREIEQAAVYLAVAVLDTRRAMAVS
jgi:cysteine desulfurase